jgi:hypothetical protein
VQLDISQELSNSVPTTSSKIDSPTIQERRLSTTVVVKNGDTVALGGLITENVTKSLKGRVLTTKLLLRLQMRQQIDLKVKHYDPKSPTKCRMDSPRKSTRIPRLPDCRE